MKKFFVLFGLPSAAVEQWVATVDEETRAKQSHELMHAWQEWMKEHADMILDGGFPLGKTKRVTAGEVTDTKNELNWYLIVQAESHQAAADLCKDHPQLSAIPSSYIEVMASPEGIPESM